MEDELDKAHSTNEEKKNALRFQWGSQKERFHQGNLNVGENIILKRSSEK
jgi:hypothetical protein